MGVIMAENLRLDNYLINFNFLVGEAVAFWSLDKGIISRLFRIIAGINKSQGLCFYHDKHVFDNKEYFDSRLYFDYKKKYLSTLKSDCLEKSFSHKYNVHFDKHEFKRVSDILDIRGETEITSIFAYTRTGNTFVNFALTRALSKPIIIINNPTAHIMMEADLDIITAGLTDKDKFEIIILGPDNLYAFKDKLDKVIFFSNYNNNIITASKKDSLVVVKTPENNCLGMDNVVYHNKNTIIALYSKDAIKDVRKMAKCEIISIFELEKHI